MMHSHLVITPASAVKRLACMGVSSAQVFGLEFSFSLVLFVCSWGFGLVCGTPVHVHTKMYTIYLCILEPNLSQALALGLKPEKCPVSTCSCRGTAQGLLWRGDLYWQDRLTQAPKNVFDVSRPTFVLPYR